MLRLTLSTTKSKPFPSCNARKLSILPRSVRADRRIYEKRVSDSPNESPETEPSALTRASKTNGMSLFILSRNTQLT